MLRKIEKTKTKTIYHYDCDITIQHVFGCSYTNGKDDMHITIHASSSTSGANWDDKLAIADSTKFLLESLGARATKKHIIYGKQFVPKNSALSKLKDYMALAELLECEMKNLFSGNYNFGMSDCDETGYPTSEFMTRLDNSKNNRIFVNQ